MPIRKTLLVKEEVRAEAGKAAATPVTRVAALAVVDNPFVGRFVEDLAPLFDLGLEVGEELWDADQCRLTLFFDPGRIKRGLRPHLEAGPPLTEGEAYRLTEGVLTVDGGAILNVEVGSPVARC